MPVIARDAVASDHLVYAWPFPIGPDEYEVACGDDEQVVMCPAWTVGGMFGPGRHRWRSPDPTRPVGAFFVLTAPVEVSFDMTTAFQVPTTGQPVRLRATGSVQVRCADPTLLIAQFVGLPFDALNAGILRSVSRSIERMLARLLTRRVVMAGTPAAVTDPVMLPGIIEELIAYNPAAGAVFGVELVRLGRLAILADDGSQPFSNGNAERSSKPKMDPSLLETVRGQKPAPPPPAEPARRGNQVMEASGEIVLRPAPRHAGPVAVQPSVDSSELAVPEVEPMRSELGAGSEPGVESRGAILGIGVAPIGTGARPHRAAAQVSQISGEIQPKVMPGGRVLVPGPDGLMQSATVRQLLKGYYELEVGSSGETIWVPINGVVPE